ncbi:hypothetical protein NEPAR04_0208 [Nematocida parisii]|nr:hypothetical protein NEPAR03_0202 [Nematocida parisii]KAI5125704.1 hypothetical protein NEPAR08_0142 [Nematocida parisii]KAI5140263.1 hypothetical protein NEPAR04_0208 [Nematocida parisii]
MMLLNKLLQKSNTHQTLVSQVFHDRIIDLFKAIDALLDTHPYAEQLEKNIWLENAAENSEPNEVESAHAEEYPVEEAHTGIVNNETQSTHYENQVDETNQISHSISNENSTMLDKNLAYAVAMIKLIYIPLAISVFASVSFLYTSFFVRYLKAVEIHIISNNASGAICILNFILLVFLKMGYFFIYPIVISVQIIQKAYITSGIVYENAAMCIISLLFAGAAIYAGTYIILIVLGKFLMNPRMFMHAMSGCILLFVLYAMYLYYEFQRFQKASQNARILQRIGTMQKIYLLNLAYTALCLFLAAVSVLVSIVYLGTFSVFKLLPILLGTMIIITYHG